MPGIDGVTLMMAIQAVDEVIGRLAEATADEDRADPDDQVMLADYRRAARRLADIYGQARDAEPDLPPHDALVNHRQETGRQ